MSSSSPPASPQKADSKPTKGPKTPKSESKEKSFSSTHHGSGWPKGKKRFPKLPGAPKPSLSGYVHYLNQRREQVKKDDPTISFTDINKKMAAEWTAMEPGKKQHWNDIGEKDKERYQKAFEGYKETEEYKEYVKKAEEEREREVKMEKKEKVKEDKKKVKKDEKSKKSKKLQQDEDPYAPNNFIQVDDGSNMPVFSSDFLEHNKSKEFEVRKIRKETIEMDEQNAVLQKHVGSMESAVGKLNLESEMQAENSANLAEHVDNMRLMLVQGFKHLEPGLTMENVDAFMERLRTAQQQGGGKAEEGGLLGKAREAVKKMDYSQLIGRD